MDALFDESVPSPCRSGGRLGRVSVAVGLLLALQGAAPEAVGQAPADGGAAAPAAADDSAAADAAALAAVEVIDHGVAEFKPVTIKPAFTQLDGLYTSLSPKVVKRVSKSIGAMFAKLKPRIEQDVDTLGDQARNGGLTPDDEGGTPYGDDPRQDVMDCYHLAIGLLYDKPEGPAVLLPVLKLPHVKRWPEVQVLIIEGLGHRGDGALLAEFEPYLEHASPIVASAAAEALGRLRDQPMDVRRRAAGAIIDAWLAAQKASDKEAAKLGEDDEHPARAYLSSLNVGFRGALTSLTGQTFGKPVEWRTWWESHAKDAAW